MGFVEGAAFGRPAVAALQAAITGAKGGDLLAPVTVVVPSNYAGLSLRRVLSEPGSAGLLNVRFLVLARMAELLGAPLLAAQRRRPLTPWLRREAIRRALQGAAGTFEAVCEHPATVSALDTTFRELRDAPEAVLQSLSQSGKRAADVVAVFRAFRAMTAERFYDQSDLSLAAAEAVRGEARALNDVGQVIVYLPRTLSVPDAALVRALNAAARVRVIVGMSGDSAVDALAAEVASQADGAFEAGRPMTPATATEIVRVNDPEEEVRQIIRMALKAAAGGARLDRMAILYPARERYALLIHEQCRAAGIPHNGPAVGNLTHTVAGRTLLAMLQLRGAKFRRDVVMDWLTSAPIYGPGEGERGRRIPAQRWDRLSREAGIVAEIAQWKQRLEHYWADQQWRIEREQQAAENGEPSRGIERMQREQADAKALQEFIQQLQNDLRPPASGAMIGAFAMWASGLLQRYLPLTPDWPDDEASAYEEVLALLEEIAESEALLPAPAPGNNLERQFRQALTAMLEARGPAVGRFGEGIFFGPLTSAPGLDFDVVFVPGMTEGQVPAAGRDDPLLPDSERKRDGVSGHIRPRELRRLDERRSYLAALAAPRSVLLFPRADLRSQAKNLPSRWLLESANALAGEPLGSAEFEALEATDWLSSFPSFQSALLAAAEPASGQEYAARSLLRAGDGVARHYLFAPGGALNHGLDCASRRQPRFRRRRRGGTGELSRWEGGITARPELVPSGEHPASPTRMEQLARCPFRYFLEYVLNIPETKLPEDALSISATDRGSLLHAALDEFLRNAKPRVSPEQPWSEEERLQLRAIGERLCGEAEARGQTGKRVPWRADRARILRDVALFLDYDEELRRETGMVFGAAELSFGMGDGQSTPPVVIEIPDGGAVSFRGRIDRIDTGSGGRLAVYDYKGGSASSYEEIRKAKDDPTCGARHLQLPVYAIAAQQAMGSESPVRADYWFVSEREGFRRIGFEVTNDTVAQVGANLGTLTKMMGAGLFPARPGKADNRSYENCKYCPYNQICPAGDRAAAWNERSRANGLQDYVTMSGDGGRDGAEEDLDD